MRVSGWVRILLTSGLVLVWAMPQVVAVQVWYWMTNYQNGVVNYVLTRAARRRLLPARLVRDDVLAARPRHALIVWGALPFVAITLYAALSQVPRELVEAAEIDGARAVARLPRRDAADPHAGAADPDEPLDPLGLRRLHAAVPADRPGAHPSRQLPDGRSTSSRRAIQKADYGRGAAISMLMLVIVALLSFFYVRKMVQGR